jgi:hypothetical protein
MPLRPHRRLHSYADFIILILIFVAVVKLAHNLNDKRQLPLQDELLDSGIHFESDCVEG